MDEIVDQYREIATSLGLDKKSENAFVLENINRITKEKREDEQRVLERERDDKQMERQEKVLQIERQEKVLQMERQDKERERSSQLELEKEKLRFEASERDRTQQFELEKLRLLNEQKRFELETNTSRQESQTSLSETRNPSTRWN